MKLTVTRLDMTVPESVAVLFRDDCLEMGVGPTDRIRIACGGSVTSAAVISDEPEYRGRILIPTALMERCGASDGDVADVAYSPPPESIRSIRKKIHGGKLTRTEIDAIVGDIMDGDLSGRDILAFVSAFNVNNADVSEIAALTRSMADTGRKVDLGVKPVFDFHSLGGVPGNKITPIVVSIVASEGLVIPKMSSRAISSACGTADFIDTFCDVEMDTQMLLDAVGRTKAVFACGNEDYAPVGQLIIRTERPMGIDPRPTMIASILSKKVAIGSTHLLMDLPMGEGAKVPDMESAHSLARDMIAIGELLGIRIECAVSRADQPIGTAIGPILEARECISVLEKGEGDPAVVDKACSMAGIILEMAGFDDGIERAYDILRSGRALAKFREIVAVQNGDPDIGSDDLVPGEFWKDVHAKRDGIVQYVDNRNMVAIAKGAGAPADVGAGILLLHKRGDRVKEGDALFRIYAESRIKLERAVESARSRRPMFVEEKPVEGCSESIILERIPSRKTE